MHSLHKADAGGLPCGIALQPHKVKWAKGLEDGLQVGLCSLVGEAGGGVMGQERGRRVRTGQTVPQHKKCAQQAQEHATTAP